MLRYNYKMLRIIRKFVGLLGIMVFGLVESGCSSISNISYPSVSNIKRVAQDALTPAQQKEAINDLTLEQKTHQSTAIRDIENKK